LKHIIDQAKLNKRHVKWVEFIEIFPYIIKHKKGKERKMSLSMFYLDVIPCSLNLIINFFDLESITVLYATNVDFKDAYENCREGRTWNKYVLQDGLLYHANKLCVLASFVRILFLQETHIGGLMGHFGVKRIEDVLASHFFW
jgi:hypothetical protein